MAVSKLSELKQDDHPAESISTQPVYRCPGSSYTISHAVHLGRLGNNDPACRECQFRNQTQALSPSKQNQITESLSSASRHVTFTDEYVSGTIHNQMDESTVRRLAYAYGVFVRQQLPANATQKIALCSSRPHFTAALTAAACDGLRHTGSEVWDFGAATIGSLMLAMSEHQLDGGLFLGNPTGKNTSVGISFWATGGRPISQSSGLETIEALYTKPTARPVRCGGSWRRCSNTQQYLSELQSYFHALRPLRIVYHSACEILSQHLTQLSQNVACEFIDPFHLQSDDNTSQQKSIKHQIRSAIRNTGAHFGLSINGDGDVIEFFDEQGESVASENILLLLAKHGIGNSVSPTVVAEDCLSDWVYDRLRQFGYDVVTTEPIRSSMFDTMKLVQANLAGGRSGRYWFAENYQSPDALKLLAILLNILSQSDCEFSKVLAEVCV